jgi:hypothetical protein
VHPSEWEWVRFFSRRRSYAAWLIAEASTTRQRLLPLVATLRLWIQNPRTAQFTEPVPRWHLESTVKEAHQGSDWPRCAWGFTNPFNP